MAIPKKVEIRIMDGIKKYAKILEQLLKHDVNESDTVSAITDMLSDIFGYDKYLEVTSEYAIRNTYCDLAIKQNGEVVYLIECKAIGSQLKEDHLRQAVEYSALKGIDWAILTNGQTWKVYKIHFTKPLKAEELFTIDFLNASPKDKELVERIFMLTKEAISKSVIEAYLEHSKVVNKHTISAILLSDDVLNFIRKKLRIVSGKVRVDTETIKDIIQEETIKREIVDSEEMHLAIKKINKAIKKEKNSRKKPTVTSEATDSTVATTSTAPEKPIGGVSPEPV